ncbi:MAG: hypothetical protein EZS28_002591 [Streblomastix strix]|uniref:Uncharacterized protein n=1 Tax=Streblomastix strix TaxID=222440 RepID=A0A5J4X4G6_9EUKA|nr:MAG: hypothetical protein EZS28_002591 [Streblomastix strix]
MLNIRDVLLLGEGNRRMTGFHENSLRRRENATKEKVVRQHEGVKDWTEDEDEESECFFGEDIGFRGKWMQDGVRVGGCTSALHKLFWGI